jgi:hypothetical protein
MAIKFKKQAPPLSDPDRSQLYEDITDKHPKVKNSEGIEVDLFATAAASVFGNNFQAAESLAESSTTSTSFVNKVSITTPTLEADTYLIAMSYNYQCRSTSYDFIGRLTVDGSEVLAHRQEFQDSGSDQWLVAGATLPVALSDGSHTINIDYAAQSTAASIKNARLSIWRAQ